LRKGHAHRLLVMMPLLLVRCCWAVLHDFPACLIIGSTRPVAPACSVRGLSQKRAEQGCLRARKARRCRV